jgi:hypothetical protein
MGANNATAATDGLQAFREEFYGCLRRRADALCELCDAILAVVSVPSSPVHLSLEAVHRRGWGSLYAALKRGAAMDTETLRGLLASDPLNTDRSPVYAVDLTTWPRCDAESSAERGYYYHPSRQRIGAEGGPPFVRQESYERNRDGV